MKTKLTLVAMLTSLATTYAFGYGLGSSTHPLEQNKSLAQAEFTTLLGRGKGFGVQARYIHKLQPELTVDAGVGIGSGERNNRVFAGADYEIFPDHEQQPRVSARIFYENASEFKNRRNILGLSPVVSKGFSFWGKEAYPFVALPLELNLNPSKGSYETQARLTLGMTGEIPMKGDKKIIGNIEANINLEDSFTGFLIGASYPLN